MDEKTRSLKHDKHVYKTGNKYSKLSRGEKPASYISSITNKSNEEPTAGVLTMQSMLKDLKIIASYERIRSLMRKAEIKAIYPRQHLTVLGETKYVHPYLLRHLDITKPNIDFGAKLINLQITL